MEYRTVGASGLKVSRLVLGGSHIGSGEIDEVRGRELVNGAFDRGINTFYSADIYSEGRAQEILGKALKEHSREDFVFIHRIGMRHRMPTPILLDGLEDDASLQKDGVWPTTYGLSRKHLSHALDTSLKRLQLDYVDILSLHTFDPATPLEETLETLDGFVRAGKALYVGCAHGWPAWQVHNAQRISERSGLVKLRAFQTEYNLLNRWPEREQLPACEAAGVGVFAFNALGGNFLTGELNVDELKQWAGPDLHRQHHTSDYATDECIEKVHELVQVGKQLSRSPTALAQGWVLSHPAVTALNVGPNEPTEFEPMLNAIDAPLTEEEIRLLESRVAMLPPPAAAETKPAWHLF